MKILMVMLEGQGGMFQYGALLANALTSNHDVHAIVPRPSERVFSPQVDVTELPVGDTKKRFIVNTLNVTRFFNFARRVREIGPDVIHFHNPYSPWTCVVLPWLKRYPKVTTIPEGNLHGGMQGRIEMRIARNLHGSNSDSLIALCEFDRMQVEKYAPRKPIFVIPHGINTIFIDANTAAAPIGEQDSVLFFGGIAPFKGLEYLLEAFAIVQKDVPDAKLTVAGRGSIQPYLPLLSSLKGVRLDNRFIPKDEAAGYFRRAKFLVMPYVEDDHSGVIPIAYAFGRPVVVSNKVCDMVEEGKTGLVVPERDPVRLAQAIVRLLRDDSLRRSMGQAALMKARTELSWERIAEQTASVYRHAIGLKNGL